MNKQEKYRKLRKRLELVAFFIAYILEDVISSLLGIEEGKLISKETALRFAIFIGVCLVLNGVAVRIADKWYERNMDE